jgi:hypothetical protein
MCFVLLFFFWYLRFVFPQSNKESKAYKNGECHRISSGAISA